MLRNGKVKETSLKRSVLKEIGKRRPEVLLGAQVGEGISVLESSNRWIALTANPITIPCENIGKIAVHKALNNLFSQGVEPIGIVDTILLPEGAEEASLKTIVRQIEYICSEYNVQIIGGHTEVTKEVKSPIVNITALGTVKEDGYIKSGGAKVGDDLILTKWIGLEGTSIIVREKKSELLSKFAAAFVERAEEFGEYTSVFEESKIAYDFQVDAMHDASQGGIFGALWELAEASKVGLDIDLMSIPIRQETVEICEIYGINPYELLSGGCLLIATKDGDELMRLLEQEEIPAVRIGQVTAGNDRILRNGEEIRYLDMPQADEILKIFD